MDKDEKIKIAIEAMEKYLDSIQASENTEYPAKTLELRNRILFAHATVESLLQYVITKSITSNLGSNASNGMALFHLGPFLEEIDFFRLLKVCKENNLITKEEHNALVDVNTHRRNFSHPNLYKSKIKEYSDPETYLSILRIIAKAIKAVIEISERHEKLIDKRDKERVERLSRLLKSVSPKK